MSLKKAIDDLGKLAADLTQLEVITYTGEVRQVLKDGKIDWDNLAAKASTEGSVKLVAATLLKFDGDAYNFQTSEELPRVNELVELHRRTLDSSVNARQAVVNFFTDSIKNAVK